MQYNSDSERATFAIQFLVSMWNEMRTTVINLAETLYKDVATRSAVMIHLDVVHQRRPQSATKSRVHHAPKEENDLNLFHHHKGVKEEVQDNDQSRKLKCNTKSLKGT